MRKLLIAGVVLTAAIFACSVAQAQATFNQQQRITSYRGGSRN